MHPRYVCGSRVMYVAFVLKSHPLFKAKEKRQAKLAEIVRDDNKIKGESHVVRGMTFDGLWFSSGAFDSLKQDTNRNKDPSKPAPSKPPKTPTASKKRKQREPDSEPEIKPEPQPSGVYLAFSPFAIFNINKKNPIQSFLKSQKKNQTPR